MKKLLLAAAIVVLLAAVAIPYVLFTGPVPLPTKGSLPIAHLVPDSVAYYVETQDLRSTWRAMERSAAVRDFQASSFRAQLERNPDYIVFSRTVEDLAQRAGYELSSEHVMNFVGLETALAWTPDHGGQGAAFAVLTRLDTDALYKDLLRGEASDLPALWSEIRRRGVAGGLEIRTEERDGLSIAHATTDGRTVHCVLLDDVLVVASTDALLVDVIARHRAEGQGSLGKRATYVDEIARLPEDRALLQWVDYAALAQHEDAVVDAISRDARMPQEARPNVRRAVAAWIGAFDTTEQLALALRIPGGDIYQTDWVHSRSSAEAFDFEPVTGPLSRAVPGNPMLYVELTDCDRVLTSIEKSKVVKELGQQEIVRELRTKVLGEAVERMRALSPLDMSALQPQSQQEAHEASVRFTVGMTELVSRRAVGHVFEGDGALALDIRGEDDFDVIGLVRLSLDGCALMRAGLALEDARTTRTQVGAHTVVSRPDPAIPGDLCVSLVGDVVVVSNRMTTLRGALELLDAGLPARPESPIEQARAAIGGQPWNFGFVAVRELVERVVASELRGFTGMDERDLRAQLTGMPTSVAWGWSSAPDFSSMRCDVVMPAQLEGVPDAVLATARAASEKGLTTTSLAPRKTILHVGGAQSFAGILELYRTQLRPELWSDVQSGLEQVDEFLGVSVENELIPALGDEFAVSFVARSPEPPSGTPPNEVVAPPDMTFMLQVKNRGVVQRVLDRLVEHADEQAREQALQTGRAPERFLVRDSIGSARVLALELDPRAYQQMGVTYAPVLGFVDDMLVFSSDRELFAGVLAARDGGPTSLTESGIYERALRSGAHERAASLFLLDWNGVLNQVADSPLLVGGIASGMGPRAPFPEYPDNGDMDEWNRRMAAYENAQSRSAQGNTGRARQAIDALRFVDLVTATSRVEGEWTRTVLAIRFVP